MNTCRSPGHAALGRRRGGASTWATMLRLLDRCSCRPSRSPAAAIGRRTRREQRPGKHTAADRHGAAARSPASTALPRCSCRGRCSCRPNRSRAARPSAARTSTVTPAAAFDRHCCSRGESGCGAGRPRAERAYGGATDRRQVPGRAIPVARRGKPHSATFHHWAPEQNGAESIKTALSRGTPATATTRTAPGRRTLPSRTRAGPEPALQTETSPRARRGASRNATR